MKVYSRRISASKQDRSSEISVGERIRKRNTMDGEKDETKLYRALLDVRMKLAEEVGTAPYAICGDQTIKEIAKVRPLKKATLATIDGVNQYFMDKFGDCFLQNIGRLSQELNLSMDWKNTVPDSRNLSSAWFQAWSLWEESGLSFQEIASLSTRAPIREQTIVEYIFVASQHGCKVNWARFSREIGLTVEIASQIRSAITKVGSRDRLKPIKAELPESVTYDHIKTFLAIDKLGKL